MVDKCLDPVLEEPVTIQPIRSFGEATDPVSGKPLASITDELLDPVENGSLGLIHHHRSLYRLFQQAGRGRDGGERETI